MPHASIWAKCFCDIASDLLGYKDFSIVGFATLFVISVKSLSLILQSKEQTYKCMLNPVYKVTLQIIKQKRISMFWEPSGCVG